MALQDGLAPSFCTHAGMLSSMTGCSALCWDAQLHTGMLGSMPGCSPLCWDAQLCGGMLSSVLWCLAPCQDAWLYVGMLGSVLGCSALYWDAQLCTRMLGSVPGGQEPTEGSRRMKDPLRSTMWSHSWDVSPHPTAGTRPQTPWDTRGWLAGGCSSGQCLAASRSCNAAHSQVHSSEQSEIQP